MDFLRYADLAAGLVNARLETPADVAAYLDGRQWLQSRLSERDVAPLRRLQRELRRVFAAAQRGDEQTVVDTVNDLLSKHPVTPHIAGHDSTSWHLHVAERGSSVAALVSAECLMGLATLIVDFGATRLGICSAERCDRAFIDTSPNQSRRYCSERCSSRANVAAYRARRRAGALA